MKTLGEIWSILAWHKLELQARFGVRELAIFGSYARGEATPVSDVDLLVALERPLGWEIVDLRDYLEALLGLPVDLLTAGALRRKPHLWQVVQEDLVHV
ncbi:nucleotidyltransferase family protein [Thermus sp. FJN-A]